MSHWGFSPEPPPLCVIRGKQLMAGNPVITEVISNKDWLKSDEPEMEEKLTGD